MFCEVHSAFLSFIEKAIGNFSPKVFWEVFGYIGTALVIFSMTRTSVVKLRIFNICGSVISLIYAAKMNTWPVVFLNGSLVAINIFQLIRTSRTKIVFNYVKTTLSNDTLQYFAKHNMEDIKKYFPKWSPVSSDETEAHIVYMENEVVGVLTGKRINNTLIVGIDYSTPKFRDLSVASFLFAKIKDDGVDTLQAQADVEIHEKYLKKMGFTKKDDAFVKSL